MWRWDSDPFGTTTANENPSGLGTFQFNLRYPGMYADVETGPFYNYFRDYDPSTGRYVESDPIGLTAGPNTYVYSAGNPISRIDPFGLWSKAAHDYIFEMAFGQCKAAPNVARLQEESDIFDRETGIGIEGANWHSMRKPFQSQASAIQGREEFISNQLALAADNVMNGDGSLLAEYFARAAHAVQDSTSPAHVSDTGELYAWPTPGNATLHGDLGSSIEDLNDLRGKSRVPVFAYSHIYSLMIIIAAE